MLLFEELTVPVPLLTVMVTVELEDSPLLSVAVNLYVYTPTTRPVTVVVNAAGEEITVVAPAVWLQVVDLIVAPLLPVAVPVKVTVAVGCATASKVVDVDVVFGMI